MSFNQYINGLGQDTTDYSGLTDVLGSTLDTASNIYTSKIQAQSDVQQSALQTQSVQYLMIGAVILGAVFLLAKR
jgi:hypothetical protein